MVNIPFLSSAMRPACFKVTPLNEFQLAAVIPRRFIETSFKSDVPWGNDGDMCVICLGDMVAGDEVSDMPHCNHTFHLECVTQWLESNVTAMLTGRCPTCNSLVISPGLIAEPEPATQTQLAIQVEPTLGGFRCKLGFENTKWVIAIIAVMVLISMTVLILLAI